MLVAVCGHVVALGSGGREACRMNYLRSNEKGSLLLLLLLLSIAVF
jgi:hypothetical protein